MGFFFFFWGGGFKYYFYLKYYMHREAQWSSGYGAESRRKA